MSKKKPQLKEEELNYFLIGSLANTKEEEKRFLKIVKRRFRDD